MRTIALCLLTLALVGGSLAVGEDKQILHSTFINASGSYEVTITETEKGPVVDIVRHNHENQPVAHYAAEALSFVYARPSPKRDRLILGWETGSAMFVTVFRLAPVSKASPVLAKSTESEPEFVYAGGHSVMLLYSGRRHVGDHWMPKTASLYSWDGEQYDLVKTVPYESRFEALISLEKKGSP